MARVYLETSFISACVSTRTDAASIYRREASLEWMATQRPAHTIVISAEVHHHTRFALGEQRMNTCMGRDEGCTTPPRDEFIEEVRALKRAASERSGHVLARIAERLREPERKHSSPLVQPPAPAATGRMA